MRLDLHRKPWTFARFAQVSLVLMLFASVARADSFTWQQACGTTNWYTMCTDDPAVDCSTTPHLYYFHNNWGRQACGNDPGPAFPGWADSVVIGSGDVGLGNVATINNLSLGAGCSLGVNGDPADFTVSGGIANSGTLIIANGGTLLAGNTTFDNTGSIILRYGGYWGQGLLSCTGNATFAGGGEFVFECGDIIGGGTLTNAAGHTIRGAWGRINAALINEGTVTADWNNHSLELRTAAKTNNGRMGATNGSFLDLFTLVNQGSSGVMSADGAGSRVRLYDGAAISGGTLNTADDGVFYADGCNQTTTFADLTNNGTVDFYNHATLALAGTTITNNGVIGLHYLGYCGGGQLRCDTNVTLDGSGEVHLENGAIDTADGVTLTQAATHTIHGADHIHAAMINNGTIDADLANQALTLDDKPKTNTGTMEATAGGFLDLSTAITQTGTGQILADGAGSRVRLYDGAAISGGTLNTADDGVFYADGCNQTTTFTDLTNNGTVDFYNHATLALAGTTITNNGVIGLHYLGYCGGGQLRCDTNVTLDGSGEVHLENGAIDTADGVTLTQAATHTIHGADHIHAALINNGTIDADLANQALTLDDHPKTNTGTMKATGGGFLDVNTAITQTGTGQILADGIGSQVRLYGGAAITGGTLNTANGGVFYACDCGPTTTFSDLTNDGDVVFTNRAILALTGTAFTNNGTVSLNYSGWCGCSILQVDSDLTIDGTGDVLINCGQVMTAANVTLTNGPNHTIHGLNAINAALLNNGTIRADVNGQTLQVNPQGIGAVNNGKMIANAGCELDINTATLFRQSGGETIVDGTLRVNGGPFSLQGGKLSGTGNVAGDVADTGGSMEPGNSVGTLRISGNYTQGAGGRLSIQLGGPTQGTEYDLLNVTGTATLAGELQIEPSDGYHPPVGTQYVILTAAAVNGSFATVVGPGTYDVTVNPGNVTLTVLSTPQLGDLNCDGSVNGLDIDPFVLVLLGTPPDYPEYYARYPNCDHSLADCNQDGDVNELDIEPFIGVLTGR